MGARQVIGIEPDPRPPAASSCALGADHVLSPGPFDPGAATPHAADPALREAILDLTDGVGADVAMEMSGFNSSLNNAIQITRRGGHVVLFGLKNGDAVDSKTSIG